MLDRMRQSGVDAQNITHKTLARVAAAYFNKWFIDHEESDEEDPIELLIFQFLSDSQFH